MHWLSDDVVVLRAAHISKTFEDYKDTLVRGGPGFKNGLVMKNEENMPAFIPSRVFQKILYC